MSDIQDEDANSISPSQSHSSDLDDENETENGYESNDTDSLNLDEEEEEDDGGSFPLPCLSDRLVGGSLVLHIDQTGPPTSAPSSLNLGANQSTSTTTSLSDTASENTSIRAVMGDTPSTPEINMLPTGDEDAGDNSSQVSTVDSEAERVRRIHNSIFSSLENDLAELVRIREETIQFLETGVRSSSFNGESGEADDGGSGNGDGERNSAQSQIENVPFALRERLTYYTRPFSSGENSQQFVDASTTTSDGGGAGAAVVSASNMAAQQARSYTPIAKFDNASPGKPAKPYVEVGLTSCDEKASAARKILDKLQYGDPEDEGACFVRRFWRETSTVVENTPTAPLSLDVAAIAQRTASLQASLEEAFDGLRLRLQQTRTPDSTTGTDNPDGGPRESGGGGDADNNGVRGNDGALIPNSASSDYQNWDRETSIMNDPLNYDIWNELEDGSEAGPTITARINLAERRAIATTRNRRGSNNQRSSRQESTRSTTVAVGTNDSGTGNLEGAEFDDESTDDEEMLSYFRFRNNNSDSNLQNRPHNVPSNMNQESREFFRDIGISDEMGQDLLNMFTFSEEDVQVPSDIQMEENSDMNNYEIPQPLFPRECNNRNNSPSFENQENAEDNEQNNNQVGLPSEMDGDTDNSPPQIPLMDDTPCIHIAPNREDECSTRVYLDENYLDFPFNRGEDDNNGNMDQQ